jgi:hypothetical protein
MNLIKKAAYKELICVQLDLVHNFGLGFKVSRLRPTLNGVQGPNV